jgi:hypothetical protein
VPLRARFWAPFAAAACLVTSGAAASESFPDATQADLDLSYAPGCDLCHAHADAPVGGASKPFAASLVARGLVAGDDASLAKALVADEGVDSDGDGARDLDELSWGGDPNHPDVPVGKPPPEITYGCGGSSKGAPGGSAPFALAFSAGLAACLRRRRGR